MKTFQQYKWRHWNVTDIPLLFASNVTAGKVIRLKRYLNFHTRKIVCYAHSVVFDIYLIHRHFKRKKQKKNAKFYIFDENTQNTYIINVFFLLIHYKCMKKKMSEEEMKANKGKNCITYIYIYLCFYTFMLIYYIYY